MTLDLERHRSLLGKEHQAGPFPIPRELVDGFCSVLGETNPLYIDEEAARRAGYRSVLAPPTLCTMFVRRALPADPSGDSFDLRTHTGQVLEPLAPIETNDVLTASSCLKEVYPKTGRTGTMVFMVWEVVFTNQRGERVARVQQSYATRA